jgi:hypothetical protein
VALVSFTPEDQDAWSACVSELTPSPYLGDPVGWVHDKLGEFLWSKQRQILESLRDNRYTAVQSCHGAGKSFVSSRAVAWWLSTKTAGDAFAVTTAPTAPQVSAILWREIRKAHKKGELHGYITQGTIPEWKLADGESIGYGRKPADYDQSAFQGIHSRYPIIVIDEGGGVPKSLFDAVDALATNSDARVLCIGNPDDPSSHFAKICQPGSGWNVIKIDALESPLFTREACEPFPELVALMESEEIPFSTEEVPEELLPMLVSPMWVAERIKRWGAKSPIFEAKVRGLFPEIGDDILITPRMIREAQERSLNPENWKVLGVDVARFGTDRTIFCIRSGPVARIKKDFAKLDTVEVTTKVLGTAKAERIDEIRVDGVGIGGGVVDQISAKGFDVIDMQAGGSPENGDLFMNARAEWYWYLRQRFETGQIDLDPEDDELAAQLGAIHYAYDAKGRIKIESKQDMKKRGMPSPDRADALMLTAAESDEPGTYVDERLVAARGISPV